MTVEEAKKFQEQVHEDWLRMEAKEKEEKRTAAKIYKLARKYGFRASKFYDVFHLIESHVLLRPPSGRDMWTPEEIFEYFRSYSRETIHEIVDYDS
jgi:hypothetical protein